jgi:hypothetical protein
MHEYLSIACLKYYQGGHINPMGEINCYCIGHEKMLILCMKGGQRIERECKSSGKCQGEHQKIQGKDRLDTTAISRANRH